MVKNPPANSRDEDFWVGKILGGGHGNLLQYSCLENSTDREAWWATIMGPCRVGHNWILHITPYYLTKIISKLIIKVNIRALLIAISIKFLKIVLITVGQAKIL